MRKVLDLARESQEAALGATRPGATADAVHAAAMAVIDRGGCATIFSETRQAISADASRSPGTGPARYRGARRHLRPRRGAVRGNRGSSAQVTSMTCSSAADVRAMSRGWRDASWLARPVLQDRLAPRRQSPRPRSARPPRAPTGWADVTSNLAPSSSIFSFIALTGTGVRVGTARPVRNVERSWFAKNYHPRFILDVGKMYVLKNDRCASFAASAFRAARPRFAAINSTRHSVAAKAGVIV